MTGKNGEHLYPTPSEPELAYEIDVLCDTLEEFNQMCIKFLVPVHPEYKNRDEHFTKFITKGFPAYLKMLDEKLKENGGHKYLLSDEMTLADIIVGSYFLKLCYNDMYDNQHICQAVLSKFPKVNEWAERIGSDFGDFFKA